jgi:hypothetical protein
MPLTGFGIHDYRSSLRETVSCSVGATRSLRDHLNQVVCIQWFAQNGNNFGVYTEFLGSIFRVPRNDNRGNAEMPLIEVSQDIQSVHLRHVKVEEQAVGTFPRDGFEQFIAGRISVRDHFRRLQKPNKRGPDRRVVVENGNMDPISDQDLLVGR